MNILCPNCQKPISVDERYAGQLVKCPLCNGTFTVPLLPDSPPAPRPAAAAPDTQHIPPHQEGYGLAPEPPPPPPVSTQTIVSPPPATDTPRRTAPPPPPSPPPAGYAHVRTLRLSPEVMPWIAPAALLLAFVVSFFPWLGAYPNGVALLTQSGWQAAFGGYSGDWQPPLPPGATDKKFAPGASALLIVGLLIFFLPAVVLAVAVALLQFNIIHFERPPIVQQAWPVRQWIVAGVTFVALLFLILQILAGFRLISALERPIETRYEALRNAAGTNEAELRNLEVRESQEIAALGLRYTGWLWLFLVLEIVAVIAAVVDAWLERRGNRPPPQFQFMW